MPRSTDLSRRAPRTWLAALLIAALAVAGVTAVRSESAAAAPPERTYVALGDSYAAGPLIPAFAEPYGCLKSTHNYANLLAPRVDLALRDVTCSGAETEDMWAPQRVSPGPNPAQFDALDVHTQLVTVQIGGNDIGFSSIIEDCTSPTPLGQPCQDAYVRDGVDELRRRIAAAAPDVRAVLDGIRRRAPQATVVALGYPAILPEDEGYTCWPQLPIAHADVPYLRGVQKALNAMIAEQAAAARASYVDLYGPSIGHDSCQPPGLRWVEPLVPASAAAPVHPNLQGMFGMADVITRALGDEVPLVPVPLPVG